MNALRRPSFTPLLFLALALAPGMAQAHPGTGSTGFAHGFAHPLQGLDHVLAMLAVGLWAAQLGGRARWIVPTVFVSVMAAGGALGMEHLPLPFVQQGILASVLVLGVLVAGAVRLPLLAGSTLVGLFACFHGFAHGLEMPETAAGLSYGLGFILTTALLHGAGLLTGMMVQRGATAPGLRLAGATIALGGVLLCF